MNDDIQEKDHYVLYVSLTAIILVSVILMVKSNETDKFAPIKQQIAQEQEEMNIRILN